jgi:hypothetical protein
MHSTAAEQLAGIQDSVGPELLTFNQEHAPGRSAGLITAETSEAFPPAGGPALEVDPVRVVSTVAAADAIGNRIYWHVQLVKISQWRRTSCCTRFRF